MMPKPSGRKPRQRRPRYELPDREHPVQVEDVDGVTVVVRTHTPLTEDERHSIARYIEQLQVGGMDPIEVELPPDSLRGVPDTTPLDEATVWLSREDVQRRASMTCPGCGFLLNSRECELSEPHNRLTT